MPKYRTVSSSDQPNWSIHNGVPSLKKRRFPKRSFFSPNAFCFCSLQNLGTGFNKFANIKTFLQYCSLAILQLLLFRAIKEFPKKSHHQGKISEHQIWKSFHRKKKLKRGYLRFYQDKVEDVGEEGQEANYGCHQIWFGQFILVRIGIGLS